MTLSYPAPIGSICKIGLKSQKIFVSTTTPVQVYHLHVLIR
jgi:hypothetical protein